jgi:hypothetical protein
MLNRNRSGQAGSLLWPYEDPRGLGMLVRGLRRPDGASLALVHFGRRAAELKIQ